MSEPTRLDGGAMSREGEHAAADVMAQRPPPGPIDDHRDDDDPIGDPPDRDPTDDPDDEDEGEGDDPPLHASGRF